ncbi:MAG: response regulator [Geminicoccaceae bacterium]
MTALRTVTIAPGQTDCDRDMTIGLQMKAVAREHREPPGAEVKSTAINIEGAVFEANGDGDLLFLGTISPLEVRNLQNLALRIDEFGPVDPSPALAVMAELNATMLADAQQMNSRLEQLLRVSNQLAEELENERAKAVQASKMKSEFLANMSHEIRTPINGILGNAELMLETELNQKQEHYAQTIGQSSEMLLALVNDILDFSKAESGELNLESAPFDLLRVVEDVAELLSPNATAKNIDLAVRYVPDTPHFVIGDSVRIRQILCNLIGNAIKFTSEGYVLLTVELAECAAETEGSLVLKMSIRDTGIGIPPDKQGLIFERFAQADGSTTRNYGGTGLGLSICKRLVELMDGEIQIESVVGVGSTFSFTVVLDRDRSLQNAEVDHSLLRGKKLLIVDDLEVNRMILDEQLGAAGLVCTAVESSLLALEALREAHLRGQPFDFVILDYMMPVENGMQLAARIQDEATLSQTILIMLSSADPGAERDKVNNISAFLAKPARRKQLHDCLTALNLAKAEGRSLNDLDEITSRKLSSGNDKQQPQFELRVLLVEDNRVNRTLAKENLTKLGCDVTTAEDGKVAIERVEEAEFDIILMDCQMPVMDGFEASRVISKMGAERDLPKMPIIALTANAMPGDRERCLDAGMDDYLTKPLRKKNLIDMLTKWAPSSDPVFTG